MPGPRKWPLTGSAGPGSSQEPQHSAHSTALTESTNSKKLTNVLFHFIAKIPNINLTTGEVSVSPASYSVSLRKQMTPHSKKKKNRSGLLHTSLYLVMLSASFREG